MYAVAEKFVSINGEGTRAGELAVFIRFRGCNLNCSYCDTRWANDSRGKAEFLTCAQIAEYVSGAGITNVTLTGGEPLLQRDIYPLIAALMEDARSVEIETNGSIDLKEFSDKPYRPVFTMDYKLPSSGMEAGMRMENFGFLREEDTVKFVVGDEEDLERAAQVIREYDLTKRCHVYFSPVFGRIHPETIAEFMKKNKMNHTRLQLQLHKYIWDPQARGV